MSHGKPVVTNAGSLTEPVWNGSGAVMMIPSGNPSELVASVDSLLADQSERDRLGSAAKIMYLRHFDLVHTITALRTFSLRESAV